MRIPPPTDTTHATSHTRYLTHPLSNSEVDVVTGEDGAPRELAWSWTRLVMGGLVEYVDAEEEEAAMIAMHIRDLAESR